MPSTQLTAIVLSVLAIGAGAVSAATVATGPPDVSPPQWANDDEAPDVNVSVDGDVAPGATVALTATLHGEPVPHAPVEVNGERVGETDADGQLDVTVPADADEFEVEVAPEFEGETTVPLGDEAEADEADDADDDDEERRIDLAVDGNVTPDESVTVTATVNGTPLAGADVSVDGEEVGTTDADGTIQVTVPEDDEFEVEAEYDHEGEYEVEFEEDDEDEAEGEDDTEEEAEDEDDEDEAEEQDDDDTALTVTVDGDVSAGETVTVTATYNGSAVENATVTMDDEVVGATDANGQLAVVLPADLGDELEVEVEHDHLEGEWEREFEDEDDGDER